MKLARGRTAAAPACPPAAEQKEVWDGGTRGGVGCKKGAGCRAAPRRCAHLRQRCSVRENGCSMGGGVGTGAAWEAVWERVQCGRRCGNGCSVGGSVGTGAA
eukprot:301652-Chlamydomonas_euryale.AAC.1